MIPVRVKGGPHPSDRREHAAVVERKSISIKVGGHVYRYLFTRWSDESVAVVAE